MWLTATKFSTFTRKATITRMKILVWKISSNLYSLWVFALNLYTFPITCYIKSFHKHYSFKMKLFTIHRQGSDYRHFMCISFSCHFPDIDSIHGFSTMYIISRQIFLEYHKIFCLHSHAQQGTSIDQLPENKPCLESSFWFVFY